MSKRIVLTGTSSGAGKTTITMGILAALKQRGLRVKSFKSGPDYIDPMFHKRVLGIASGNLDLYLMGEEYVKWSLMREAADFDISVIEGAMGYYDGISTKVEASAYELAKKTETNAILITGSKGMGASLGAIISGFQKYQEDSRIVGVILNQTSPMMKDYYGTIIEEATGLPLLGCIPKIEGIEFESRHLGLKQASEIEEMEEKIEILAENIEKYVDLDGLLELAEAGVIPYSDQEIEHLGNVKVAIARDEAFTFYYDDSLEILSRMGVEWVEFSPLHDRHLPPDIHGIYMGGGYPELHLKELSENQNLLQEIKAFHEAGKPFLCECGGFMVLMDRFVGDETYPLMGLISGEVEMTSRLQNFGYAELTAQRDTLLAEAGDAIRGHEFHYSKSTNPGDSFIAQKPYSNRSWPCVHGSATFYGGYPHIHLGSNKKARERFVQKCIESAEQSWQKQ